MPSAPLRTCPGSPTCRNRVVKGPCRDCARKRDQLRGSRHERGYDAAWVALTEQFWRDSANKYCRRCAERGVLEPATQVDHVVPFEGREDPRRLDRRNLQPLCGTCNRQKALEHRRQRAYDVVWSGEQDARGQCPSLVDGTFARPSTLTANTIVVPGDEE
jgi:5-methylcytosine-specific restriction endonuclease McrA